MRLEQASEAQTLLGAGTLALVGGIDDDGSDGGDDEQDYNEAFGRRAKAFRGLKFNVRV